MSGSGINLDQDFGYEGSTPAVINGTVWEDSNADGTLDTPAEPNRYEGVTVDLYEDVNNNGIIDEGDRLVGTDTTDNTGAYSFGNLPAGKFIVDVTDDEKVLGGAWHSRAHPTRPDRARAIPSWWM